MSSPTTHRGSVRGCWMSQFASTVSRGSARTSVAPLQVRHRRIVDLRLGGALDAAETVQRARKHLHDLAQLYGGLTGVVYAPQLYKDVARDVLQDLLDARGRHHDPLAL